LATILNVADRQTDRQTDMTERKGQGNGPIAYLDLQTVARKLELQ